jgi:hypothetical protein
MVGYYLGVAWMCCRTEGFVGVEHCHHIEMDRYRSCFVVEDTVMTRMSVVVVDRMDLGEDLGRFRFHYY